MKNLKLTAAAAVLSVMLGAAAAQAQVNVNFGDLVLGFRNTSGQGTALNLEVNLGSFNSFLTASSPIVLSGPNGLAVQDLVDTYGASWNTNSGLLWSVGSTSGSNDVPGLANNTLFVTSTGTVFKRQTSAQQQTMSDNITNFNQSLNGVTPTSHSTMSSVIDTTNTGTANYTGGITGNGGFGRPYNANSPSLLTFATVENNTNIAPGGFVSLKLDEMAPTASGTANAVVLGTFELFGDGTLEFVPQAVPEPSTWVAAALSAAVVAGFTVVRRRKTNA